MDVKVYTSVDKVVLSLTRDPLVGIAHFSEAILAHEEERNEQCWPHLVPKPNSDQWLKISVR